MPIEPVAGASRYRSPAARTADGDTGSPSGSAAPPVVDDVPVRPWVPDDDAEGPVVGAALDRWAARRAAPARFADSSRFVPDGVADVNDGDGVADGDGGDGGDDVAEGDGGGGGDRSGAAWSADPAATATDAMTDQGADGLQGDPRWATDPEGGGRPVSRGRAALRRSLSRRAELWVPEPLRGSRVDPGRRGAMALLLVAALAAAITAVGVWRDRPEARPVATVSPGSVGLVSADPPQSATAPAPSGSPDGGVGPVAPATAPAQLVVSVTGLVRTPGVVTVPGDARVADAITAAGGLTDGADVTGLNLAAKLTDGASIVVGAGGGSVQGADSASSGGATGSPPADGGGLVDLNSADADELDTLPGVGPVMAGNIIAWREANGRFSSVDQLQEISGIGPARYAQLSPLVSVS